MRRRPAPWRKAFKALTILAGLTALAVDVRPARPQTPFDLFRERVAMSAAGARCHLFDAETASALAAGGAHRHALAIEVEGGLRPRRADVDHQGGGAGQDRQGLQGRSPGRRSAHPVDHPIPVLRVFVNIGPKTDGPF